MKMTNQVLVTLVMVVCCGFFFACSDEEPTMPRTQENEGRGTVTELDASVSNPSLISSWENVTQIVLNKVGNGGSDILVTVPWADGASTKLSTDFCKDIKKADGWMMLFHTFKQKGLDEKQNYICFYNLFTGVLKVFYYFEGGAQATNTTWFLQADYNSPFRTLDEPTYFSLPDDVASANTANMLLFQNESITNPNALEVGWNGFEYQIPRYSTDLTSCRFTIGAYSQNIQNVTINGEAKLETSGVVNSVTTNYSGTDRKGVDGIATYAGNKAENFVRKTLPGQIHPGILNDIISGIPSAGNSIVKSVVSKGLGFIFGRTTTITNYYTTSDVRLNTMGNIYYTGTLTQTNTAGIPAVTFDLWSILNPYTAIIDRPWLQSSLVTPVVPLKQRLSNLGTWTVTSKPVVYWNLCYPFTFTEFGEIEGEFYGTVRTSQITRNELNVKFSPYIEQYITSSDVKVEILAYQGPTEGSFGLAYAPDSMGPDLNNRQPAMNSNIRRAHYDSFRSNAFSDGTRKYGYIPTQYTKDCYVVSDLRPNEYDEDTEWYVNWEIPRDSKRVVLVTVTMNITYCGHSFQVKETRQYLCEDRVEQASQDLAARHNPPKCVVLVPGNSWILNRY